MRIPCSQCRKPIVVDEMSDAERIGCPSCGTDIHVRVGQVAEPPRPVAPPPLMMPMPTRRPVPVPPPVRPPVVPPAVGPVSPAAVAPIVRRAPIRPPVLPPGTVVSAPAARSAPAVALRSCPACGEKLAQGAIACTACGASYQRALRAARGEADADDRDRDREPFQFEKDVLNGGVIGGIGAMILGSVWFLVGYYMLNRIFFYAPILVVVGLIALFDGVGRVRAKARRGKPRGRYN